MWSRWAWVINKKFWLTALEGHLPISKAALSWGTITQVSWPPIDTPSIEYPSKSTPFLWTSALALLYSSSSSIALPIVDKIPREEAPLTAVKEEGLLPRLLSPERLLWFEFLIDGRFMWRDDSGKGERIQVKWGFCRWYWQIIVGCGLLLWFSYFNFNAFLGLSLDNSGLKRQKNNKIMGVIQNFCLITELPL